jgi:UDP-glucuronate 4-epimerase
MARILVTGCAGFIGFHVTKRLLDEGHHVTGVDNLNDYYDVSLKESRLAQIQPNPAFQFHRVSIADRAAVEAIFRSGQFEKVINLAAQVGPRYSIVNPHAYVDSNLVGFINILEGCRHARIQHLVYASSSSVYGANPKQPFSVSDRVDHPVSLYAATKKANELMAYSYAHLYRLPCTGLRFFTVYGPWGRPDMAPIIFTRAILEGRPIDVYNYGKMRRDFTYIDDIIEGIRRVLDRIPSPASAAPGQDEPWGGGAPAAIYNIGNNSPVELMDFIRAIESATERRAQLNLMPAQPGDVPATWADIDDLQRDVGFSPHTPLAEGIPRFVAWFREYYRM